MEPFAILGSLEYFREFVERAYDEYCHSPTDTYRVKSAFHQMNVMAERVWQSWKGGNPDRVGNTSTPGEYRSHLARQFPDFQLVRDVDDAHKHVVLNRPGRVLSTAGQTGLRHTGGAIGTMAIGETALGGSADEYVVVLDDGSERRVAEILHNTVAMWRSVLEL